MNDALSLIPVAALAWGLHSWRRTGAQVSAQTRRGTMLDQGVVSLVGRGVVSLRDPWRDSDQKSEAITDAQREGLPVIATFLQNRGRTAMTVTRCRWVVGEFFTFEPQTAASPWGDLLPVRIEANDEAVVVHEAEQMRYFLEAVMSDHHVRETKLGLVFDLGNGEMLEAEPLLEYKRSMSDRDAKRALAGRLEVSPVLAAHPFAEG